MSRKDTIYTHRHVDEELEVGRVIELFKNRFNISITKLEASSIVAARSKSTFWSDSQLKKYLQNLRGIY